MPGRTKYHTEVLGLNEADICYIDADLVFATTESGAVVEMAFGDPVTDVEVEAGRTHFKVVGGRFHGVPVSVKGQLPLRDDAIFSMSMVDVQQGDGMIIDTPSGHLITIDGGENQLFARHLAARFAGTKASSPLEIDMMIVTHGDADHFEGLNLLRKSEKLQNTEEEPDRVRKRVFVTPAEVLHNGLVKRPGNKPDKTKRKDTEMFGASVEKVDGWYATELENSPLDVAADQLNKHFKSWVEALNHWGARRKALGLAPTKFRRVDHKAGSAFKTLTANGLSVDLLGPISEKIGSKTALKFYGTPDKDVELHLASTEADPGPPSASHTVNGHSITFRLKCGNVRFMFTGDLNQESMARMESALGKQDLESEVLKTPHHGSADFDFKFLKSVAPVVSIISSGDENAKKEHIHPRASLVSALGRASRGDTGIVLITELAAFFSVRGRAAKTDPDPKKPDDATPFFAFERTNFGIIHIRTDGERVLVFTHSGKRGMNEAYGFTVDDKHKVKMTKLLKSVRG